MPKVISFANMKGGVGKTTLAVNIAFETFRSHKKVLLIDNDPQFNATSSLIKHSEYISSVIVESKLKTIYDIYERPPKISGRKAPPTPPAKDFIKTCWYLPDTNFSLDIIPSRIELYETLKNPTSKDNLLNKFITKNCQHYDYIFIDCPPTPSILTTSALAASNHVIIPVFPGFFSTIGIPQFFNYVNDFKDTHHDPNNVSILGVIINALDRKTNPEANNAIEQVRTALEKNYPDVKIYNQMISKFKVYEKSLWQAVPTRKITGRGTGSKTKAIVELNKLTNEILLDVG